MRTKILLKDIIFILLGVFLFFLEFAQNTILYYLSFIVLLFAYLLSFFRNPKVNINVFLITYLLYIVYQLFLYFFHITLSNILFFNNIKNLIIIFIVLFIIYNIIISDGRMVNFMKLYININFLVLFLIIILSKNTLFIQRLAHSYAHRAASFYIFGMPVYMSSNPLSFEMAVAFLFSIYFYKKENNKKYLFLGIFFIIGNLLCGSRKGTIVLISFLVWLINEQNKGKYLKKIIISVIIVFSLYFSVLNIPFLYNIVGERFIDLQNYVFNDEISQSVKNRDYVKELALNKISQKLFIGYGEGSFSYFFSNLTQSNSENNYLELLMHGGLIGLIIYYFYVFHILKNIIGRKKISDFNKMFLVIMIVMIIIEFGSVHYNSIKLVFFIILYFSNYKLECNEIKEIINKK